MVEISSLEALAERVGQEIAVSDWLTVSQERIDRFAEATGDHQWIHVDRQRAAASVFGTTIAHGFLTLSLSSTLLRQTLAFPPLRMTINYGVNRVRFITPVRSGSRIRARITPASIETFGDATQVTWKVTIEIEGTEKPAAVVEWIVRYYPDTGNGGDGGNGGGGNGGDGGNG
jgi:acyl dehydratase